LKKPSSIIIMVITVDYYHFFYFSMSASAEPPAILSQMDRSEKIAIGVSTFFSIVFSAAAATASVTWVMQDTFASQTDLAKMEDGLRAEIVRMDNDWKAIFARMESERRADLAKVDKDWRAAFARMERERKTDLAKIDQKFDRVDEKLVDINNAIIRLERSVSDDIKGLNRAIGKIEGRLDVIERHLMPGMESAENQPSG